MTGHIEYMNPDGRNFTPVSAANPLPVTTIGAGGVASGTAANPVVTSNSAPADRWYYAGVTGGITDTADVVIKAAAGASVRNYLTRIQYANGAAAVSSEIVVKDGSTIIWRGWAPQGGATVSIPFDPPLQSTANTAFNVAMITTASATRVSAQGYTGT